MAIAELTEEAYVAEEAANEGAGRVRVAVHDASRIEWSLSVPLPEDVPLDYSLRVELQIPQNTFVRHAPWDQMQAFTRLDGPACVEHEATPSRSISCAVARSRWRASSRERVTALRGTAASPARSSRPPRTASSRRP